MLRPIFSISVVVCALLGIVHSLVTFVEYDHLSPDAIWFAGTGLALILLAALNWITWGSRHPSIGVRRFVVLIDFGVVVYGIFAVRAVQAPQAFVLLGSFVGMLVPGLVGEFVHGAASRRRA